MNAQGVDISVWQDNNSTPQMFDPIKARRRGASFVGIKVSQANWADPDYAWNWADCRRRLYRMPFHFLVWDVGPWKQAELFWSLIEKDTWGLLPLVCDFEWWKTVPTRAMDILYSFMERLRQLSDPLPKGIYTAKSFWDPNGSHAEYWKQYHLWLCDITGSVEVPKPWNTWNFWQYTFKLRGLEWGAESLDLDGDYYNGTLTEMIARYSLPELDEIDQQPISVPFGIEMTVVLEKINLRSSPLVLSNNDIGDLYKGEKFIVDAIAGKEAWAHGHTMDGREGWAAVQINSTRYMV